MPDLPPYMAGNKAMQDLQFQARSQLTNQEYDQNYDLIWSVQWDNLCEVKNYGLSVYGIRSMHFLIGFRHPSSSTEFFTLLFHLIKMLPDYHANRQISIFWTSKGAWYTFSHTISVDSGLKKAKSDVKNGRYVKKILFGDFPYSIP